MRPPRHSIFLALFVFLATVPELRGQTTPSPAPKAPAAASQAVRACIEQLDILACEHAEKLRLPPKKKAEVIVYEYSAGPVCAPELLLDKAIKLDPQNALAYFLKAEAILCTGNRDTA